ncbi:MAG TPA: hypothetical protein PKW57_08855, partial [Anaerolineaceae bacterium]|nr:hypothetical protein [Anaerolineaceae bacterium]
CRSTRPTTTFCRVALPLHPTYDCRFTRPTTTFCRVALPLHPTYDCCFTRATTAIVASVTFSLNYCALLDAHARFEVYFYFTGV